MLLRVTYDAQEGFLCGISYCGTLQYSALVNSVFLLIHFFFFGLTLTFVYKYTICMAWRFHLPPCKYDFKTYFKNVHSELPTYLQQLSFDLNVTIHNHNTRGHNKIHANVVIHEFAKRCLRYN